MKKDTYLKLVAARDLLDNLIADNMHSSEDPAVPLLNDAKMTSAVALLREVATEAAAVDPVTFLTKEETEMLRDRCAINAVKSVRNRLGIGLKEAKDIIDQAGLKLGIAHREPGWGIRWS